MNYSICTLFQKLTWIINFSNSALTRHKGGRNIPCLAEVVATPAYACCCGKFLHYRGVQIHRNKCSEKVRKIKLPCPETLSQAETFSQAETLSQSESLSQAESLPQAETLSQSETHSQPEDILQPEVVLQPEDVLQPRLSRSLSLSPGPSQSLSPPLCHSPNIYLSQLLTLEQG